MISFITKKETVSYQDISGTLYVSNEKEVFKQADGTQETVNIFKLLIILTAFMYNKNPLSIGGSI